MAVVDTVLNRGIAGVDAGRAGREHVVEAVVRDEVRLLVDVALTPNTALDVRISRTENVLVDDPCPAQDRIVHPHVGARRVAVDVVLPGRFRGVVGDRAVLQGHRPHDVSIDRSAALRCRVQSEQAVHDIELVRSVDGSACSGPVEQERTVGHVRIRVVHFHGTAAILRAVAIEAAAEHHEIAVDCPDSSPTVLRGVEPEVAALQDGVTLEIESTPDSRVVDLEQAVVECWLPSVGVDGRPILRAVVVAEAAVLDHRRSEADAERALVPVQVVVAEIAVLDEGRLRLCVDSAVGEGQAPQYAPGVLVPVEHEAVDPAAVDDRGADDIGILRIRAADRDSLAAELDERCVVHALAYTDGVAVDGRIDRVLEGRIVVRDPVGPAERVGRR